MTQRLPDSAVSKARNPHLVAYHSLAKQHSVEPEKYGAFNQTRGCLLGWDVDATDLSASSFNERIPTLKTYSGAGFWLVPFRGISVNTGQPPIDLIYLNVNSVVIDVVESFPISRISTTSPLAATVLVLPGNTISSTQTRRGDQLLICAAAEFNRQLPNLAHSSGNAETTQAPGKGEARPTCSGPGDPPQRESRSDRKSMDKDGPSVDTSPALQSRQSDWNDQKKDEIKPTKNWLQRWWSPDPPEPRKAPRELIPGLEAHFWTGGAPVKHGIRDMSLTGLYVVTEERWSAGTVVRMTLTDSGELTDANSITVNACVVRWGNDGFALRFVMKTEKELRGGKAPLIGGIAKKELDRFLELARSGMRHRETRVALQMAPPSENEETIRSHTDPVLDDLFIGPVSSSLLIESLKDLPRPPSIAAGSPLMNLSGKSPLPQPGAASDTPLRRRPCILLIDDDYLDIMFLAGTLEEDYEVIFASDGVTALETAGRCMPDLILLDVMMPGIDGFEVCRRLKADNRTKEIPVIFITGLSEASAEAKGLGMGAADYINKPFHAAQLRVGVSMHISARRHGKARSNGRQLNLPQRDVSRSEPS